jgi:hypothetical protein
MLLFLLHKVYNFKGNKIHFFNLRNGDKRDYIILHSAFGKSLCTKVRYVALDQACIDPRGHHFQHLL